jgi:energy-coupling factor transporter ATP-binding protein EcfA2
VAPVGHLARMSQRGGDAGALGVSRDLASGLLLRHLASAGTLSGASLEARMGLRYEVLEPLIEELSSNHLIDQGGYANEPGVEGRAVGLRMNHVASSAGRQRAAEIAAVTTHYLGPCPVALDTYVGLVRAQAEATTQITPPRLASALAELELEPLVVEEIGSAMASRSSVFIYGPPGNGKSSLARSMASLLGDPIDVPYAVAVGEEIIRVFDPIYHRPAQGEPPSDRRLVRVGRPLVRAGGELQLGQLELTHDAQARYYESPLQLKASGGVLVIDDFGRQAESPARLLNRFIVPMEEGVDYLDLAATGHKIEVPFTCQVVFSTNLAPAELVDEAFLRRIAYKILVSDPSPEAYARIFERECAHRGLATPPQAVSFLLGLYQNRPLRGSHPKQLIARLVDRAAYRGEPVVISPESLGLAFDTYLNRAFEPRAQSDGSRSSRVPPEPDAPTHL